MDKPEQHSTDADPETGIVTYLHCRKCLAEIERLKLPVSPKEYAYSQTGFGPEGQVIVWCTRHNVLIMRVSLDTIRDVALSMVGRCEHHTH